MSISKNTEGKRVANRTGKEGFRDVFALFFNRHDTTTGGELGGVCLLHVSMPIDSSFLGIMSKPIQFFCFPKSVVLHGAVRSDARSQDEVRVQKHVSSLSRPVCATDAYVSGRNTAVSTTCDPATEFNSGATTKSNMCFRTRARSNTHPPTSSSLLEFDQGYRPFAAQPLEIEKYLLLPPLPVLTLEQLVLALGKPRRE